ncbi:unnamed protein product [Urochloa humidicola]
MAQSKTMTAVIVAMFLTAFVVAAASATALTEDSQLRIQASCSNGCAEVHKDPADTKQCADFCVFASKYLHEAYSNHIAPTNRVVKFRALCTEGCAKEYKDPAIVTKCVDYCNVDAKELEETYGKDKVL